MPPKAKKRKGASTSSASFDEKRFVTEAAYDRFKQQVVTKVLVPERGILIANSVAPSINGNIAKRNWEEFVKQPEAAVIPIVREFYANAADREDFKVFVRGKWVSFDKKAINRFYKLTSYDNDEYSTYMSTGLDMTEVLQTIAQPGAKWKVTSTEAVKLKSSELSRTNKAWLHFIGAKLMPVSHTTTITKERAILLFAIISGKSIDVGKVIQDSIVHCIKGVTTGGLVHPSLITGLCRNAGVTWSPEDELQHPQAVIDKVIYIKYSSPERSLPAPVTHNEAMPALPTDNGATPSVSAVPSLDDRLARIEQHIDQFTHRINNFMAYQISFNNSLSTMFSQCALNSEPNAVQFPQTPVFPEYPPEDENQYADG